MKGEDMDEERTYKIRHDGDPWTEFPYTVWDPEGREVGIYLFLWAAKLGLKRHKRRAQRRPRKGVIYTEPAIDHFGPHLLKSKRLPGEVNFPGPKT
jgi:hypothetical protein